MNLFRKLMLTCAIPTTLSVISGVAEAREQRGLRACYGVVTSGGESPDIRLMRVATTRQRVQFNHNRTEKTAHCPAEVDSCQQKAFVVVNDLVLAGPDMEDFTCATYMSPKARQVRKVVPMTIGFLPRSELAEVKVETPSENDWLGAWHRHAEAEIWIDRYTPGRMKVGGWGTYGALDPERVKRGAVNIGTLDGIVANPTGTMIALGEGYDGSKPFGDDRTECKAKLQLFGPYLVVEDNGGCGGNNVSFTGIYVRLKKP